MVEPAWDNAKAQLPEGLHIEDNCTWSSMAYLDVEVYENPLQMQLRYDASIRHIFVRKPRKFVMFLCINIKKSSHFCDFSCVSRLFLVSLHRF